jgi:uncharacterized protein (DUF2336 family)
MEDGRMSGADDAVMDTDATQIARDGQEERRAQLAGRADTAPELLYYLAADPAVRVRAAVASNAATPPQADRLLAGDQDEAVRVTLARRVALLAPGLAPSAQDRLGRMAWETLKLLAEDAAVAVRAAVAETIAEMPDAPRELILQLARDITTDVAGPVLRLSPLLADGDLLALIADPPMAETRSCIARRQNLSERIGDALVAAADGGAIAALLENPTAAIREATLDALILASASNVEWQARLIRRPTLSPRATRALAALVVDHLLGELAARSDLDPALAMLLRTRLDSRLARTAEEDAAEPSDEVSFLGALARGDREAAALVLSRACGSQPHAVQRALRLRSAKALASLCWTAGFSPEVLEPAQAVLGRVPAEQRLSAPKLGGWPLTPDEMRWQIDMLNATS